MTRRSPADKLAAFDACKKIHDGAIGSRWLDVGISKAPESVNAKANPAYVLQRSSQRTICRHRRTLAAATAKRRVGDHRRAQKIGRRLDIRPPLSTNRQ